MGNENKTVALSVGCNDAINHIKHRPGSLAITGSFWYAFPLRSSNIIYNGKVTLKLWDL